MSRFRKVALIVAAGLVLLAGGLLWALPEIVRRVALEQIPKRTGRAAAIEDIDLNLFTGRLAIKGFRLADREGPEPFVEFERFDVRLGLWDLLRAHFHVREVALVAPSIRVVRRGPAEFNFSDLLATTTKPAAEPSRRPWAVTVGRLDILRGRVRVDDRAVSPPAQWLVQDLGVEARSLTTRPGAAAGQLSVRAQIDEALLTVRAEPLRLAPLRLGARLSLERFAQRRLDQYVYIPMGTPYRPKGGTAVLTLVADVDSDDAEVRKATLSGALTLEGEALTQVGRTDPFVSASRLGLEVREADLLARTLTVARVDLEGLDLKAHRDAQGVIDLVEVFTPKARPAAPAPPAAPSPSGPSPPPAPTEPPRRTLFPVIRGLAAGFKEIRVERITLTPSTATFVDDRVKPPARLSLTKLQARVDGFTWPVKGPATIALSAVLPRGGTLDIKGPLSVAPFDAELTVAIRDAPVEPYQAYIPVPARLSGRYNGDSRNRIAFRDGRLVATSKGNSWAQNVEIREPGVERPAIRVERMELLGIDFDWPRLASAKKAGFRRPRVEIERSADGSFNLRRLFATPGPEAPPAPDPAPRPGPPAGSPPKDVRETMRLEFGEVRIDDGFIRFLDRTTRPAFSQDLSRLALTVTDYGNRPGRRAKLALESVVGGDAGLDIRGEIGPLGAPTFVDLVGELRSYKLPSVDPYAAAATGWVIKRGDLQYKVRFKLDGTELSADNDVAISQLQVAPASGGDEVKRRIGLPLGLIVALIKDQKGEIRVNVPVAGTLKDPKFSLGDAIWTAVKNVLVNVVTSPFKAIGRLFSGGEKVETVEEPRVDPVTFAAGSSVLSPGMEEHLLRVADFLRQLPFVNLALAPVPGPGDAAALKGEAVAAALEAFRKERGAPDAAAVLADYYKSRLPDVPFPPTVEEQMALLREREPAPDALLADLGRRRVAATRERLQETEGIPETRLTVSADLPVATPASAPPASPPELPGGGRVEFAIMPGE
ncbi:MAG TPA: DUF748 domain-containing protein [Methylomirabilota bacterium]|jgi:hypothetical protein|nr:DUF748 domain-containing protein [Methylomirabilota bacterium]